MTPSVRLSLHGHATQSQGLAAIWLPLWKEQCGHSTPPWNTRPLCYKNQQLTSRLCGVLVWFLVGGVAERGVRRLREQEQHCGMRGRTAGQLWLELGSGTLPGDTGLVPRQQDTSAQGCWPVPTAAGHPGLGTPGLCPRGRGAGADAPGPAPQLTWTRWSSGVL